MRRLAAPFFAAAFVLCSATTAFAANKYPPGPHYRSCPDTLTIFDAQQVDTLLAPCHPAILDTVRGIGGIITAFDAKPSAYAVYFQNSQGGPWSGIQAFTGAYNYNASPFNLALGDSVVVYGTMQEFPIPGGTTEIEGPDVIQSTNDIVIRKVSSGHPLPPFQILSTHDLNWVPGPETPAPRQEQWEECLVRVRGPLTVARTSTQGGSPTLPFNSFLMVNNASPAESLLVEGNALTTLTPPPVNTPVDSVQGIVIQNTTSAVNSYRVTLRSAADLFTVGSPNITDAYPINDTFTSAQSVMKPGDRLFVASNETLRLVFDRNVDVTSAQNPVHYLLASGIDGSTVNAATVVGGSVVLLDVTEVRVRGDTETLTANGIGSTNCPSCLMPSESRTFVNGVLRVADVQAPDAAFLAGSCEDRSRFAGSGISPGLRATMRGVGVGLYGSSQFLEDATGGPRTGILVFGPSASLTRGHQFLIAGQIQEFGGETEMVNNVFLQDQGTVTEPAPVSFTSHQVSVLTDAGCDANQNLVDGEDYEGVLVHVSHVMVTEHRTTGQSFFVASPSGTVARDTILVSNLGGVLSAYAPPDSGAIVDVTGVLHFTGGTYRICPRAASDISLSTAGVDGGRPGMITFRAYPNPARTPRLSFTLPRGDDVHLAVYDLLGRQIAVLAHRRYEPGTYSREWNGRDAAGREVGAGVYWYRLRVGEEVLDVRGVMLR